MLWRVYTCPGGSRPDNEISESSMSPVYKLHCMQFYSGDFIYEYSLWRLKAVFILLLLKDRVLHISCFFLNSKCGIQVTKKSCMGDLINRKDLIG